MSRKRIQPDKSTPAEVERDIQDYRKMLSFISRGSQSMSAEQEQAVVRRFARCLKRANYSRSRFESLRPDEAAGWLEEYRAFFEDARRVNTAFDAFEVIQRKRTRKA